MKVTYDLDHFKSIDHFIRMGKLLRELKHENVVSICQMLLQGSQLSIDYGGAAGKETVSEFAHRQFSPQSGAMPEQLIGHLTTQLLSGLAYLHSQHIIHRSVRAQHIYLTSSKMVLHLAGFDNCFLLKHKPLHPSTVTTSRAQVVDCWGNCVLDKCTEYPATPTHTADIAWYAPEIVAQEYTGYHCNSDVYSVGLTLWELFTGRQPYAHQPLTLILLKKIYHIDKPSLAERRDKVPPSAEFVDFYSQCTRYSMKQRPQALELRSHPFLLHNASLPKHLGCANS